MLIGLTPEDAWWEIVGDRLGTNDEDLVELRRDLASREQWDLELVEALRRLRGTVRTAMVSNTWPSTRARITEAAFLNLFDELVLSCEVGYRKPDPAIFQVALGRLAVGPGDALFIDDRAENVETARSLGIAGHLHVTSASSVSATRNLPRPRHPFTPSASPIGRILTVGTERRGTEGGGPPGLIWPPLDVA